MDFVSAVRQRLEELRMEQRDLAAACEVTESYISQLLGRKKLPPLPNRTDLYEKMSAALKMPREELARLAALQHRERIEQTFQTTPDPLFGPIRESILARCRPGQRAMRALFEKNAFGALERIITRTLIESVRDEARTLSRDPKWVRSLAKTAGRSYRTMRVQLIELLDSDVEAPIGDFTPFIAALIRSWTFDMERFSLSVRLASGTRRLFLFSETEREKPPSDDAALRAFLRDTRLSAGITSEEVRLLRGIRLMQQRRVTPLFYYRMLQSLRDPLHFK